MPKRLIWSEYRKAWWRPNGAGYTTEIALAGLFDAENMPAPLDGIRNRYVRPDEVRVLIEPEYRRLKEMHDIAQQEPPDA